MKLNQTILLGAVAALGILAAVLWSSKPAAPPRKSAPTAKPQPAVHPAAPVAPVAAVAEPAAVTPERRTVEPAPLPGQATVAANAQPEPSVAVEQRELDSLIDLAVKSGGDEARQAELMTATWHLIAVINGRTLFLEMQTDAKDGVHVSLHDSDMEWFVKHSRCRQRQRELVTGCGHMEQIIAGLNLIQLAAAPLRLKAFHLAARDAMNFGDRIEIALPRDDDQLETAVQIGRVTGALTGSFDTAEVAPLPAGADGTGKSAGWTFTGLQGAHREPGVAKTGAVGHQAYVRVIDVRPRKDKKEIVLPELSKPGPLSLTSRSAMKLIVRLEGANPRPEAVEQKLVTFGKIEYFDSNLFVSFPQGVSEQKMKSRTAVLELVPWDDTAGTAGDAPIRDIPAEPTIAHKLTLARFDEFPSKLNQFVTEVTAAGHRLGSGAPIVRVVADQDGLTLVDLQVPITAP